MDMWCLLYKAIKKTEQVRKKCMAKPLDTVQISNVWGMLEKSWQNNSKLLIIMVSKT